jgi:hypothetical protein
MPLAQESQDEWQEVSMRTAAISILFVGLAVLHSAPTIAAGQRSDEKQVNVECRKLPAGKRVLKLNFKPNSEVADLIHWMSSITCTRFLTAGVDLKGKRVTVEATGLITPEEADRLFMRALESVGLAAQSAPPDDAAPGWTVVRIIKKDATP